MRAGNEVLHPIALRCGVRSMRRWRAERNGVTIAVLGRDAMKLSGWILLVVCVWAPGATLAWAKDGDATACGQVRDHDLSIRGCSRFLMRGNVESQRNRATAYNDRGKVTTTRATTIAPSPISIRRSASIRNMRRPSTIAATLTTTRATTTAPSRILIRRSVSIRNLCTPILVAAWLTT
jgi:hypothetical protein